MDPIINTAREKNEPIDNDLLLECLGDIKGIFVENNNERTLLSINDVKNFVSKAMRSPYEMDLQSDRYSVDAKSIMGIFALDLLAPITVVAHTDYADDFFDKLEKFKA